MGLKISIGRLNHQSSLFMKISFISQIINSHPKVWDFFTSCFVSLHPKRQKKSEDTSNIFKVYIFFNFTLGFEKWPSQLHVLLLKLVPFYWFCGMDMFQVCVASIRVKRPIYSEILAGMHPSCLLRYFVPEKNAYRQIY